MDTSRSALLGEIARDAALERTDFIVQATEQFQRYLAANKQRIAELGGLTLIDDEPDYLSVAPDGTFRSRSRYEDPDTGEWVSETDIIETAAEIVELYNPADVYAAFADAAKEAAGDEREPTAADQMLDTAHVPTEDRLEPDDDIYAQAADDWAAAQGVTLDADTEEGAAQRLYDRLGDLVVVDDEDERLTYGRDGRFRAEVLTEDGDGDWRTLTEPDQLVEYYDPTDMFGDLADSLAEAYPSAAPQAPQERGSPDTDFGDEDDVAAEDESGQ